MHLAHLIADLILALTVTDPANPMYAPLMEPIAASFCFGFFLVVNNH